MIDRLILFTKVSFEWFDPWRKPHTEQCLKVRMILRPEMDESIRRFDYVANNGYEEYPEYGYTVPGIGEIRHNTNRLDYVGGSWWTLPKGVDLVAHDAASWRKETRRALTMTGGTPLRDPFEVRYGD